MSKTKEQAKEELDAVLLDFVNAAVAVGDCAKRYLLEHDLDTKEEKSILLILSAVNEFKEETTEIRQGKL